MAQSLLLAKSIAPTTDAQDKPPTESSDFGTACLAWSWGNRGLLIEEERILRDIILWLAGVSIIVIIALHLMNLITDKTSQSGYVALADP